MDYLTRLAEFVAATRLDDVAPAALDRVRWVLADCVACAGAGMQVPEMRAIVARHLADAVPGRASVIGGGRRAPAPEAAFLNATAGVWHDYDEGCLEANGHPGIQCVPAALALAEERRASGADLLLAATLGYEVSARIGGAAKMKVIVHPHGTFGVIGTAVAVAKLQGLAPAEIRTAINIAGALANASNRNTLRDAATVRNAFAGHANYMGQVAVRLARSGFTGEHDAVANTFGAILGDGFDRERVTARLGDDWLAARGYFKVHANGRFIHSGVDAMLDACERAGGAIAPEAVRRIEIRTFHYAARMDNRDVANGFGAKFSTPFALATTLVHGRASLDCFDDAAAADPVIHALAQRVAVIDDPAANAAYPARQRSTVVVELADGRRIEGRCEIMRGEPGNPHAPHEIAAKFHALADPVWGRERAARLLAGWREIENIDDVAAFAASVPLTS
jgi:2-methylcitrate dehydratase PrpD